MSLRNRLTFATLMVLPFPVLAQGSLDPPPGAPAPTMKTLDQIDAKLEKRTPISSLPFTISQSGSYYLTQNLTATDAIDGITVNTSAVTIDLNGFRLDGADVGLHAITAWSTAQRTVVRNGHLSRWTGDAVHFDDIECTVESVTIDNTQGVSVGSRSVVRDCAIVTVAVNPAVNLRENCIVADCRIDTIATGISAQSATIRDTYVSSSLVAADSVGIMLREGELENVCVTGFEWAVRGQLANRSLIVHRLITRYCQGGIWTEGGGGATISECRIGNAEFVGAMEAIKGGDCMTVADTVCRAHSVGILAGATASIVDCTAANNTGDGIRVGDGSKVTHCNARQNYTGIVGGATALIVDCLAANNTTDGIRVSDGAKVTGCTARQNGDTGIEITGGGFISENLCDGNRYGIYGNGPYSRIERNNIIYHSDTGLWLSSGGNTVIANTFRGNPTNILALGSDVAPLQTAATMTNPVANIAF